MTIWLAAALGILLLPLLAYVTAKMVSMGWLMGRHRVEEHLEKKNGPAKPKGQAWPRWRVEEHD